MATGSRTQSKFRDSSTLRVIAHIAVRLAYQGISLKEAEQAIREQAANIGVSSLKEADEVFGSNISAGEIDDKRLAELIAEAIEKNLSGKTLNTLYAARSYNGVLKAMVVAGSLAEVAKKVGVSHQAAHQWVDQGYVPVNRIPEFEASFGVPRIDLINPRHRSVLEMLAEPSFKEV